MMAMGKYILYSFIIATLLSYVSTNFITGIKLWSTSFDITYSNSNSTIAINEEDLLSFGTTIVTEPDVVVVDNIDKFESEYVFMSEYQNIHYDDFIPLLCIILLVYLVKPAVTDCLSKVICWLLHLVKPVTGTREDAKEDVDEYDEEAIVKEYTSPKFQAKLQNEEKKDKEKKNEEKKDKEKKDKEKKNEKKKDEKKKDIKKKEKKQGMIRTIARKLSISEIGLAMFMFFVFNILSIGSSISFLTRIGCLSILAGYGYFYYIYWWSIQDGTIGYLKRRITKHSIKGENTIKEQKNDNRVSESNFFCLHLLVTSGLLVLALYGISVLSSEWLQIYSINFLVITSLLFVINNWIEFKEMISKALDTRCKSDKCQYRESLWEVDKCHLWCEYMQLNFLDIRLVSTFNFIIGLYLCLEPLVMIYNIVVFSLMIVGCSGYDFWYFLHVLQWLFGTLAYHLAITEVIAELDSNGDLTFGGSVFLRMWRSRTNTKTRSNIFPISKAVDRFLHLLRCWAWLLPVMLISKYCLPWLVGVTINMSWLYPVVYIISFPSGAFIASTQWLLLLEAMATVALFLSWLYPVVYVINFPTFAFIASTITAYLPHTMATIALFFYLGPFLLEKAVSFFQNKYGYSSLTDGEFRYFTGGLTVSDIGKKERTGTKHKSKKRPKSNKHYQSSPKQLELCIDVVCMNLYSYLYPHTYHVHRSSHSWCQIRANLVQKMMDICLL